MKELINLFNPYHRKVVKVQGYSLEIFIYQIASKEFQVGYLEYSEKKYYVGIGRTTRDLIEISYISLQFLKNCYYA